ncbi:hypothetical protein PHLCEN_2v8429 [Hermanssonia centrifuga]|uniref:Leucine-rich repeat-containing protein n=1 Tax=Hermanssonia centrifuga TaxID=98765 RepID=A0A2R6NTT0_9APHY|nr:hypothetical protein PHLCEN_2v8429 [Hermanssonia centrifuga]
MEHEPGDDYIRRIATYIRNHEQGLAAAGVARRRRTKASATADTSIFNPLGWFASDNVAESHNVKPVVLSFDAHHLYYLLMRMEAVGLDVGSLDVNVENPSRPMNYISIPGSDKSDAMSLRSFASTFSAVSKLSLGSGWWGRPAPPSVEAELKYIYSCLTKLPALSLRAPEPRLIAELARESIEHALPLDVFKTVNTLECLDVDPRTIIGWDKLAESLRSLTLKRTGLEDIGDVFIDSVVGDQARREGQESLSRRRRSIGPPSRQASFHASRLPDSVPEDAEDTPVVETPVEESKESALTIDLTPKPSNPILPSLKWAFLQHLSLAENALTFLPAAPLPRLASITHLDLSSNLLVSVPPGLSALYNLASLNLSDNMIDSVLGIYTMLGQVLSLNLSKNRLESICGLERLRALERVDLRHNQIEESDEIGRLATLPNITQVWVEGNPLTELEEGYRIRCFEVFWKEGKTILLDGSAPGFYEKRYLAEPPPEQMTSSRLPSTAAYSPPAVPVASSPRMNGGNLMPLRSSPRISPSPSSPASHSASPQLGAVVGRGRKKKNKRIVELDSGSEAASSRSGSHARGASDGGIAQRMSGSKKPSVAQPHECEFTPQSLPSTSKAVAPVPTLPESAGPRPPSKFVSRHARHQTEISPPSSLSPKGRSALDTDALPTTSSADRTTVSHRRSATVASRATARRNRISASVYEPPPQSGEKREAQISDAEAFRARIEALRSDMGEGWLKVFNQSHLGSPSPTSGVASG